MIVQLLQYDYYTPRRASLLKLLLGKHVLLT